MKKEKVYSAAVVVIGNEILSGRTQDTNSRHIAVTLGAHGIAVSEIRVVPDREDRIIAAVNALRNAVDYVFTTGGIGPTHDDITAQSIARAFAVPLERNSEALRMMREYYDARGLELTETRARMAMIPAGAGLIPNPISGAPGFQIGNVYVMAGVPAIMEAMLDYILGGLKRGAEIFSLSVEAGLPESQIAAPLGALQEKYPDVDMGSYPKIENGVWGATIVFRSSDRAAAERAAQEWREILTSLVQSLRRPV